MIVSVAPPIDHRTVRAQQMNEALAVRTARLRQHVVEALQRNVLALGEPLHLRGLGERIDLPRLDADAPRRFHVGRAIHVQPLDEAAARGIPSRRRPQRQGLLDGPRAQVLDDAVLRFGLFDCCLRHPVLDHTGVCRTIPASQRRHQRATGHGGRNRSPGPGRGLLHCGTQPIKCEWSGKRFL